MGKPGKRSPKPPLASEPGRPTAGVQVEAASPRAGGSGRKSRWVLPAVVILGLGAGAGMVLFTGSPPVARVVLDLPPPPDTSRKPAVLREKLASAHAAAMANATPETVEHLGQLYHANGYHSHAEACWRWLNATQPQAGRWCYLLADLRRIAGDYAGVESWLQRTVALAPDYAPAWLRLADHHFKTGRLDDAEREYQRRLALLPGDAYARLGIARILLQRERKAEARTEIERLVQDVPSFATSRNLYAEMLEAAGDTAGARQQRIAALSTHRFREASDPWIEELNANCFDPKRLCVLGTIDFQSNYGDKGRALVEKAVALDPYDAECTQLLGDLYMKLGEYEKARDFFADAVKRIQPPTAMLYVNWCEAYRMLRQSAKALEIVQQALAVLPEAYELHNELGAVLGDLGELQESERAYREAVRRAPTDTDSNYSLGITLLALGRRQEAVEFIRRSTTIQPTFPKALVMLGRLAMEEGRLDEAEEHLRTLYEAHPEQELARQLMAVWHLRSGDVAAQRADTATALRHYLDGFAIDPTNALLALNVGTTYLMQGNAAGAVTPLEAYRRQKPTDPQSALFLGQAYAQTGRIEDAKRVLREGETLALKAGNKETAAYCREILNHL